MTAAGPAPSARGAHTGMHSPQAMQSFSRKAISGWELDGFGVVAPDAGQRAALEEDGRPDARPVVQRVGPHVDDQRAPSLQCG